MPWRGSGRGRFPGGQRVCKVAAASEAVAAAEGEAPPAAPVPGCGAAANVQNRRANAARARHRTRHASPAGRNARGLGSMSLGYPGECGWGMCALGSSSTKGEFLGKGQGQSTSAFPGAATCFWGAYMLRLCMYFVQGLALRAFTFCVKGFCASLGARDGKRRHRVPGPPVPTCACLGSQGVYGQCVCTCFFGISANGIRNLLQSSWALAARSARRACVPCVHKVLHNFRASTSGLFVSRCTVSLKEVWKCRPVETFLGFSCVCFTKNGFPSHFGPRLFRASVSLKKVPKFRPVETFLGFSLVFFDFMCVHVPVFQLRAWPLLGLGFLQNI